MSLTMEKTRAQTPQTRDVENFHELTGRLRHAGQLVGQNLQDRYTELAEAAERQPEQSEELRKKTREELSMLKKSASELKAAYLRLTFSADELETRLRDAERGLRRRLIPAAPPNSVIDLYEEKSSHFAQGVNFYKLVLLCFMASLLGVLLEMGWCFLRHGYVESRAGLVIGPFNLLYGAGGVAMTLSLYHFRNRGAWLSFLGGFVIGSMVEYVCSWGQELLFGSRSWDYSAKPFNIGGRICLLYSVFWGVLGVLWIKKIYPQLAALILRLPNRVGKVAAWVLLAFLAVDAILTVAAISRWAQRMNGSEAVSLFAQFLDRCFTDSRMEQIFPNMRFS